MSRERTRAKKGGRTSSPRSRKRSNERIAGTAVVNDRSGPVVAQHAFNGFGRSVFVRRRFAFVRPRIRRPSREPPRSHALRAPLGVSSPSRAKFGEVGGAKSFEHAEALGLRSLSIRRSVSRSGGSDSVRWLPPYPPGGHASSSTAVRRDRKRTIEDT